MTYPLFDLYGTHGWFINRHSVTRAGEPEDPLSQFRDVAGNKLTLRQYIQYNFSQNRLHLMAPRLQQEWLLDQISRAESTSYTYITQAMDRTRHRRSATTRELQREHDPLTAGHQSSIPSSVRGSHAYRRQKVDMGMAHVYRYGPPTLFITFTANPMWAEIQNGLKPGHKWYHDCYLVNLVFKEKLDHLINGLKEGLFFNGRRSEWLQYAIEFQKRGLPHAHILVRFTGDQPATPDDVDKLSTVMFPSLCPKACMQCKRCALHDHVKRHMLHKCFPDRCDRRRRDPTKPQARRSQASNSYECYYGFPWAPNPVSHIGDDGKWILKRSQHEQLVAEYNPELLLTYDAHINVKVTTGSRCILYLRKYLTKGPDVTHVSLGPSASSQQELNNFYETRCMTASEAAWVALNFEFQHYDPPVKLLNLHMQNEEPHGYDDRDSIDDILLRAMTTTPHIDLYFTRPSAYEHTKFEEYFSLCDVTSKGKVRVRQSPVVATVNSVNFSDEQHFSLYMLLKHITVRSWFELLGGHESLSEHAQALGIIGSTGAQMHQSILEQMAIRHESSGQFLKHFVMIITEDPRIFSELFDRYWQHMIDHRVYRSCSRNSALLTLRDELIKEGLTLADLLRNSSDDLLAEVNHLPDVTEDDIHQFFDFTVHRLPLSDEQNTVHDAVINSFTKLHYVNGCAGSGKTYLLRQIIKSYQDRHHNVLCSAYTGSAAGLLPSAFTCHKIFKIPVVDITDNTSEFTIVADLNEHSRCINARLIRSSTVIIIDEISMLDANLFAVIEQTLRAVCHTDLPFAGKTIIIAGDFNQQAPIVSSKDKVAAIAKTIEASIKYSPLFPSFTMHRLRHAHRFRNQAWASHLLSSIAVGAGQPIPDSLPGTTEACFPPDTTITFISSSDTQGQNLPSFERPYALQLLASKHELVRAFNKKQTHAYFSDDEITSYTATYTFPPDLLRHLHYEQIKQITRANIPDHDLHLAVGMPVMIMRNIIVNRGITNGALGIIEELLVNAVTLKLDSSGEIVTLPRICFSINCVGNKNTFIRHQFPLVPAFAITIAKSQGKTLQHQHLLDLTEPCFGHGQLYVAFSRSILEDNITVITTSGTSEGIHNVVYRQLTT